MLDNLRKVHVNPEGEAVESFDMPKGLVAADTPIQALNELMFERRGSTTCYDETLNTTCCGVCDVWQFLHRCIGGEVPPQWKEVQDGGRGGASRAQHDVLPLQLACEVRECDEAVAQRSLGWLG